MFAPKVHRGHMNTDTYGQRLEPHDEIEPDDVRKTKSGTWEKCGSALQGMRAGDVPSGYIVRRLVEATFPPKPLPAIDLTRVQMREVQKLKRKH